MIKVKTTQVFHQLLFFIIIGAICIAVLCNNRYNFIERHIHLQTSKKPQKRHMGKKHWWLPGKGVGSWRTEIGREIFHNMPFFLLF